MHIKCELCRGCARYGSHLARPDGCWKYKLDIDSLIDTASTMVRKHNIKVGDALQVLDIYLKTEGDKL